MDTKTPPIPLKLHEKAQPKKAERVADVSLPPLTPYPDHRPTNRSPRTLWSQNTPYTVQHPNHRKKRVYRVLHIGATPLMHACQQGDRARVLRLLKEQEDTIVYRDRTLRNALHYCMDAGTGGAVAAAAPELVNSPDAEGHTPLHLAVIAGDTQLVAVLLANGADVNAKDMEGHSVLHWATVCGEAECVRLVLAAGAQPSTSDLRGGSPLHYAAQCCGAAATAELAVPKKVGLKVLQTLLEFGADVNAKDEDGRQPILWAASAGSVEAVLALARAEGSAAAGTSDKDGLTALHCAASRGHVRCVEALVNLCGSQPDHVDDNGCSALHYAATLGHADATALILKLGADPNRQDRKGRTPALCAAAKGQLETLKILAQHGGSLHARTVRGTGIGHEAVASGRIELIKWLAKRRPSTLDVATHDGKTPLHVAALHGHLDACKVLLDQGARINAILRTSKGNSMTALDAALYKGHRECAKLIQMHGGTTAQQLKAHKNIPNKAKFQIRHTESSTASNSSPRRRSRGYRDPELYYEERWIERRTRRKSNSRKLARRDSRSFSEEEVRLSKTTSKDKRRAHSESARYDDNDIVDYNLRKKRSRRRLSRHKYKCTDSSSGSDSCNDSHDGNEGRTSASVHWQNAKRTQKRDSSDSTDETETTDNQRKEHEDDRSVSDDSLEVVTVKKSLERKCEKVVSGKKSRTPRECMKEMKLSKMHKRTSKKASKSTKSRKSDNDQRSVGQVASSDKEDGNAETKESMRSKTPSEEHTEETRMIDDKMIESQYGRDATDSTSQETVERVVVTAMVHKDQLSDTPKSSQQTTLETSFDDVLRKRTVEIEETSRTRGNLSSSESNKMTKLSERKAILSEEKNHSIVQENCQITEHTEQYEANDDKETKISPIAEQLQEDKANVIVEGRLATLENIIPSTSDVQSTSEANKDKSSDKSSNLNVDVPASKSIQDPANEMKDASTSGKKIDKEYTISDDSIQSPFSSTTMVKHTLASDEKVEKLPKSKYCKLNKSGKIATRKVSSKDRDSNISSRRKNDDRSSRTNHEKKGEVPAKQVFAQIIKKEKYESEEDAGLGQDSDLEKYDDTKLAENVYEDKKHKMGTLTPTQRAAHEKDLDNSAVGESPSLLSPGLRSSASNMEEIDVIGKEHLVVETEKGSLPSSPKFSKPLKTRRSTRKSMEMGKPSSKVSMKKSELEKLEEFSPDRRAIIAVIHSPEWDEDELIEKEIREALGQDTEYDTEHEEENKIGIVRVLRSTNEEEIPRADLDVSTTSGIDSLPQAQSTTSNRLVTIECSEDGHRERSWRKQRRDSGGRDSGIEPSPRVSRIPRRRNVKCCPNTAKQQALNIETLTRDVQISLRRYQLERKIFFQLMELKRLQIRHGRANEQVLVKRQVEAFHKTGMSGPTLGVVKYDRALTFRQFETFLYEQLRRLQKRPTTPNFCTDAKQCTQKTHRCHHATSAYTSVPVYTYLGGDVPNQAAHLPKIESRGRGQMTVEVTHGEEKQVIALPAERLDRTKRYFVAFTVRGETRDIKKPTSSYTMQRNIKSV